MTKAVRETVFNLEFQIAVLQDKLALLPELYTGDRLIVQTSLTLNQIHFLRLERNSLSHMYTQSEWRNLRRLAYNQYTNKGL